jgi:hypothetical protein
MVNFETDEIVQEREIDILTHEITDIFRHAETILKKFGNQGDEGKISQQELTVRANMQRSMAKKLQGLSMSFRASQKVFFFVISLSLCARNIWRGCKPKRTAAELKHLTSCLKRRLPPLVRSIMASRRHRCKFLKIQRRSSLPSFDLLFLFDELCSS